MLPGRDLVQALAVVFPHRAGGVDGADAAGAQALVNRWAVPVADVEGIYCDGFFIDLARLAGVRHIAFPTGVGVSTGCIETAQ